jgi:hypothetical protein
VDTTEDSCDKLDEFQHLATRNVCYSQGKNGDYGMTNTLAQTTNHRKRIISSSCGDACVPALPLAFSIRIP